MSANIVTAVAEETGISRTKLDLIKQQIARGATDEELALFLYVAKRAGLDPLTRQIYCIKRWDSTLNREVMSTQVSIDGLRLIADRTGRYAPGRAPTFEERDGTLYAATAYVMKYAQGTWMETSAVAYYDEYVGRRKDGTPTAMWATKPHIMLAKCAEALAIRRAFPAELSGIYTSDEMGDDLPVPSAPAVVDMSTGEIIDTPALPSPPAPEPPKSARPDLDRVRALFVALHTSPETQAKKLGEMGCEHLEELTTTQAAQLIERMDKALKAKTAEATSATTAA